MSSKLRNYWNNPPRVQEEMLGEVEREELAAYARANKLVVYGGEAIKPEDYPCMCYRADPHACQNTKLLVGSRGYKPGLGKCDCPCHTYQDDEPA